MNLIANCCVGAFTYEMEHLQFSNPFIWSMTNADSMFYIMQNYDTIDWLNIDMKKFVRSDGEKCFSIVVDDKAQINYTHYLWKDTNMVTIGHDVFDKKIYEYTYKKYLNRVNRMLSINEEPTFFILAEMKGKYDYNYNNVKKICQAPCKYKTIIVCSFDDLKQYENDKLKIIIDKHPKNESGWFTKKFAEMYHKDIMNMINKKVS